MRGITGLFVAGGVLLFAALPGTDNYQLRDYGFGNGGTAESSTSNYSLEGIAGELSAQDGSTSTYGLRQGVLGSQLANLPDAPALTNPDDWYNKLHLVIDNGGNPDDTTFAVAISSDNFVTTQYVQSDDTVGSALGTEDFRTYDDWGNTTGMDIIGLRPDTTYEVKVKARQGEFSETGFGPESSAATSVASIVFDIDVSATDSESAPPYQLAFGSVVPDTVIDAPDKIWLDIDSNADNGVLVYVVSQNSGLLSATTSHTIPAVTGNLTSLGEGIGSQNDSVSQASGSLSVQSPYDGTSADVGVIDAQYRQLLSSSGPLQDGRAAFLLKVKTSGTTPAATDYADIYTFIATAAF